MVPLERLFGSRRKFPGAFPAGLRLHSLTFVKHHAHEYMVTPKLDGERRILLLGPAGAFSLDRRMRTAPLSKLGGNIRKSWTILDCELLEGCTRWVAFDALWLEGADLRDVPFADRYALLCEWRARTKALPNIHVKRAFPWPANDALLAAFFGTGGRFAVPWSEYMVGYEGEQKQKCENTVPVDGLVIMRRRATAAFDEKFDLLKWKPCPTIDVLVRSADVFAGNPSPLAYFWKYSEREQRCTVREFGRVGNALPAGTEVDTARFTVVEVAHDAEEKRWEIQRVRLDKRRANSAPTIFETHLMVDERIGRDELTSAVSVRPVLRTCAGGAWLGDVWRRCSTAELEVRVLHRGSPDLPEDTFHGIMQRLHAYVRARELVHHREESTDYFAGSVRTTVRNGSTRSIVKERVARYDLRCEESELAARLALSYEHDADIVVHGEDTGVVQYRRHKIRECFAHGGKLQVHCTRVRAHRADDDAWQEDPEVLQVELEAVRSEDWSLGSRDPVISLMWRFAGLVLGKDPRTCSFASA